MPHMAKSKITDPPTREYTCIIGNKSMTHKAWGWYLQEDNMIELKKG